MFVGCPPYADLSVEERLGLLLDIEVARRGNSRLQRKIRAVRFPLLATTAGLDLSARRGLKRAEVLQLAQNEWIGRHLKILVLRLTGARKSYLASALRQTACESDYTVRYDRTSRMTGYGTRSPDPRFETCSN